MKKVKVKAYPDDEAYSDLKVTFACSSQPVYFVEFADGYSGYFNVDDVKEVK